MEYEIKFYIVNLVKNMDFNDEVNFKKCGEFMFEMIFKLFKEVSCFFWWGVGS